MHYTVLVIDDQWSMQDYARLVLETAGYHVLLAGDAFTGLSLARTAHPDAILMDVRMSGVALLQSLRHDEHTATIPVILITLHPQEEDLPSWLCSGSSGALQKPFQPPALLSMIERMLPSSGMPVTV